MRKFTDNQGDDWIVEITIGTLRRIKQHTGIDLAEVQLAENQLAAIQTDLLKLSDLLYACVLPQAQSRDLSQDQFDDRLSDMDLLLAAFQDCFMEAYADFFPKQIRPQMRAALKQAREQRSELLSQVNSNSRQPQTSGNT